MEANEKRLLESLVRKELRRDAITAAARILQPLSLTEAQREYVVDNVIGPIDRPNALPLTEAGELDVKKFGEAVSAELSRFGAALGIGPRVTGMGAPAPVEITEAQRATQAAAQKAEDDQYKESWSGLLDGTNNVKILERAMKGRAN